MSTDVTHNPHPHPSIAKAQTDHPETIFGVNEMRLGVWHWCITFAIVLAFALAAPGIWTNHEPFPTGPDYRIPYALSNDYWLYHRRLEQVTDSGRVLVLGDSVVWGEYVRPDGTLTHFLNEQTGRQDLFVNCGVNGLFPLAMEGLVRDNADLLHDRKIIVHCNLLWMSSPKADLSAPAQEHFNHSTLVPQFRPRIPSYSADASVRMSALIDRKVPYFSWVGHIENCYYDQKSISRWTLEDNGQEPPSYPHAWENPLAPLRSGIPTENGPDPLRGPSSSRHKPWNANGANPTEFEWVDLDHSLQWAAFQRTVSFLQSRHNQVIVVVGPFNEHMIAPAQKPIYGSMRREVEDWLTKDANAVVAPQILPSELYADASHPLTEGYSLLATELLNDARFKDIVGTK
jgi:hypothetical protein